MRFEWLVRMYGIYTCDGYSNGISDDGGCGGGGGGVSGNNGSDGGWKSRDTRIMRYAHSHTCNGPVYTELLKTAAIDQATVRREKKSTFEYIRLQYKSNNQNHRTTHLE